MLYFVFDVMVLAGADVTTRDRWTRAASSWRSSVLPKLASRSAMRRRSMRALPDLIAVGEGAGARGAGREAARQPVRAGPAIGRLAEDARQPGAGVRHRRLHGRDARTFDALIFGYYEGDRLIYAARTRNGFTPATRAQLFKKFTGWRSRIARSRTCRRRRADDGARG